MRIQSTHNFGARGLDAYFTCPEAIEALILLEGDRLPQRIWEPATGKCAIVLPLRDDRPHRAPLRSPRLRPARPPDRGYLSAPTPPAGWAGGIITNPLYGSAQEFAAKALAEVPYVALLVRTNFLMDGEERGRWLDRNPPTRTWYLLPRLPRMHREGWQGKKSNSNTPFTRVVWQEGAPREFPQRVCWRELLGIKQPSRSRRKAA
jgi:hypothetical protein